MAVLLPYDRPKAVEYARRWALHRNPAFYAFDKIGGDCTNFISQCIFAGAGVMNYTKETGWYYISILDRAPAWTAVEFLYQFLTSNTGPGPSGLPVSYANLKPGDIIQLYRQERSRYTHSLFVTETGLIPAPSNILVCAHSLDVLDRPLSEYNYIHARRIHITQVLA